MPVEALAGFMILILFQDDCQDSRDSFTGSSQDGYSGFPPSYNNYPPGDPRQGPPQQHPGGHTHGLHKSQITFSVSKNRQGLLL